MLPLKLVRSLVLGESLVTSLNDNDDSESPTKTKTPLLVFLPTKELVSDTYRLATLARQMGMDLYPTPSLSHIIFSYPFATSSSPSQSHSSSSSSCWSSISLSSSLLLPNDAVPLPFPSLSTSSLSHLRSFVSLSKGFFKLVFLPHNHTSHHVVGNSASYWNCCSFSLFSRLNGDRIDTMDAFSRALAGLGWTLFKTKKNPSPGSAATAAKSVFLFRKVDSCRVRSNGGCRIRELRLPPLDFRNAPLRILQYIILMTDDVFYLA